MSLLCAIASAQVEQFFQEGARALRRAQGRRRMVACVVCLRYCCYNVCFHTWLSLCKYPALLVTRILLHHLFCWCCRWNCIWADAACETFGEPFASGGSVPACRSVPACSLACCTAPGVEDSSCCRKWQAARSGCLWVRKPLVLYTGVKETQCELTGVGVS